MLRPSESLTSGEIAKPNKRSWRTDHGYLKRPREEWGGLPTAASTDDDFAEALDIIGDNALQAASFLPVAGPQLDLLRGAASRIAKGSKVGWWTWGRWYAFLLRGRENQRRIRRHLRQLWRSLEKRLKPFHTSAARRQQTEPALLRIRSAYRHLFDFASKLSKMGCEALIKLSLLRVCRASGDPLRIFGFARIFCALTFMSSMTPYLAGSSPGERSHSLMRTGLTLASFPQHLATGALRFEFFGPFAKSMGFGGQSRLRVLYLLESATVLGHCVDPWPPANVAEPERLLRFSGDEGLSSPAGEVAEGGRCRLRPDPRSGGLKSQASAV